MYVVRYFLFNLSIRDKDTKMKLKEILDGLELDIDIRVLKKLHKFKYGWMAASKENVDFMATHLLGTNRIILTRSQEANLIAIFKLDINELGRKLKKASDVNQDFRVASNATYTLLTYIAYRIWNSDLTDKDKVRYGTVAIELMLIKMFTSVYQTYYVPLMDKDMAATLYNNMSNKFLLKRDGINNMSDVLRHFASSVIDKDGLHHIALKKWDIKEFTYILTDLKTRINSMNKEYYGLYNKVKAQDIKQGIEEYFTEIEGKAVIKDIGNHNRLLYSTMRDTLMSERLLIDNGIIEATLDIYKDDGKKDMVHILTKLHKAYTDDFEKTDNMITMLLETTVSYLYVSKKHPPYSRNVLTIVGYLKNYYTSSRIKDERLKDSKEMFVAFVKKHSGIGTGWKQVRLVNTLMIYLFILVNFKLDKKG